MSEKCRSYSCWFCYPNSESEYWVRLQEYWSRMLSLYEVEFDPTLNF